MQRLTVALYTEKEQGGGFFSLFESELHMILQVEGKKSRKPEVFDLYYLRVQPLNP